MSSSTHIQFVFHYNVYLQMWNNNTSHNIDIITMILPIFLWTSVMVYALLYSGWGYFLFYFVIFGACLLLSVSVLCRLSTWVVSNLLALCVFPAVPFRVPTVTVDVFLCDLLDCFTDFACFSFEIVCLAGSFVVLTSACFQIKVWIYLI